MPGNILENILIMMESRPSGEESRKSRNDRYRIRQSMKRSINLPMDTFTETKPKADYVPVKVKKARLSDAIMALAENCEGPNEKMKNYFKLFEEAEDSDCEEYDPYENSSETSESKAKNSMVPIVERIVSIKQEFSTTTREAETDEKVKNSEIDSVKMPLTEDHLEIVDDYEVPLKYLRGKVPRQYFEQMEIVARESIVRNQKKEQRMILEREAEKERLRKEEEEDRKEAAEEEVRRQENEKEAEERREERKRRREQREKKKAEHREKEDLEKKEVLEKKILEREERIKNRKCETKRSTPKMSALTDPSFDPSQISLFCTEAVPLAPLRATPFKEKEVAIEKNLMTYDPQTSFFDQNSFVEQDSGLGDLDMLTVDRSFDGINMDEVIAFEQHQTEAGEINKLVNEMRIVEYEIVPLAIPCDPFLGIIEREELPTLTDPIDEMEFEEDVSPEKHLFEFNLIDSMEEFVPLNLDCDALTNVIECDPGDAEMSIVRSLFLFQLAVLLVSATTCPHAINSRIQECVQPVADYAKVLNNQDSRTSGSEFGSAFSLPNMGGRVFNELCRLIAKFNSCVRDHRSTCPRHVTISLIDSSYGYLCNEGYNTFMESAECLMELDRKPSVKRCHDETLREIESANTESGVSMPAKVDRMCGALNFFSGCVRSPIKQDCGFSAWQVIYRVLKDTTNTLMPACQFTGTSQKLASFQKETDSESTTTTSPPSNLSTRSQTLATKASTVSTQQLLTSTQAIRTTTQEESEPELGVTPKKKMRKIQSAELTDSSPITTHFLTLSIVLAQMATQDDIQALIQMVPNLQEGTPYYEMLLKVIEEIGKDIRPTYTFNKLTGERLKRNIQAAKVLIKMCQQEAENDKKKADAMIEQQRIQAAKEQSQKPTTQN
ncbi:unnamed protein product [Caenorhabditis sp. 36 PRJEB53466]|nr:unnamed protein product [Caenorhabditis sp. 36 PRJEB53466]